MPRIWPLLTNFSATTVVKATLDHHLSLGFLQSWSTCFHSCLSVVSLTICKTNISSPHVCPYTPMALCLSKDKSVVYRTRPLLTLASPSAALPYFLCSSHTNCSLFPKCSFLNTHKDHHLAPSEGAQTPPSQRGPLILLFKCHMPPPYGWHSTYNLLCPIFIQYLPLIYNILYLSIMFIIYLLHPNKSSLGADFVLNCLLLILQ